jgi:hypothetical protein
MRPLLTLVLAFNALLFFFGAVQHAGLSLGRLREPRIVPAAIVESVCGVFLAWAAASHFFHRKSAWRAALIANLVALAGVVLGMAALALGAGPRTVSNDLYHRIMLALIAAALLMLFLRRSTLQGG